MNPLHQELKQVYHSDQIEAKKKTVNQDPWRLTYHVMPPIGWLNDPNGVCHFNGRYHLYYQYSPHDAVGGMKYWGHKSSTDLVHFEDHGIKLYPDEPYDLHGVYSGSAYIKDDMIHYFYTGNVKHLGDHDYVSSGREQNTIHAISTDGGFTIEKQACVIGADEYPKEFSNHIRDPKLFKLNSHYYMILGARDREDKGQVIVYRSSDLFNWTYQGVFAGPSPDLGYMWECPDYFTLDGHDVLLMSPQGVEAKGHEFQNVYQSGYMIGHLDPENITFTPEKDFKELDRGFDFYAPQTFEDESGRRIMWAWMGLPPDDDNIQNPTIERGWQHAMTMPRELKIIDEKLYQLPLEEYKVLRQDEKEMNLTISGHQEVKELNGEVYELQIDVHRCGDELSIHLRQDTTISFSKKSGKLSLNHGKSGYGRDERIIELDELKQVRVFSDMSSLEVFINGGEYVFSTRVYPEPGQDQISFSGEGCIHVSKWVLASTNERVS
ncbi:beta-fructofuranosidase [Pelagirhabdus alkalitolerans]|uniref:Sucrose-6-phosphate hydrolase n=1 Tax=Pelagirhabdus alkalitolerans TaxID=1612202 RepID=A0A1G6KCF7_9BACI|nr:sucrose-6-phosphate hydrolase [Pelagirhabdus alkalitolerans]SDC28255.1 beta-fructofuranosidase [Pelagirhabdus alkalitolerans]